MAAILMGPDGVRVLQPGATAAPGQLRPVTIDAISYTATGAVQMAGRGMPGQAVRLYLNNQPLTEFPVAADGGWGGVLPEVAPGRYTLRADQIGAEGVVTARFETPFQRETLAALAAATGRPVEDDPSSGKPVAGADISGAATSGDRPAADPAPVTVAAVSSAADGTAEPAQGAATRPATAPPAPTTAPVPTAELLVPAGTAPTAQPATRTETVAVPQPAPVLAPAVEPAAPQPDLVAGTTVATVPAAVPATSPAPPAAAAPVSVTVQPGFTLWAIARDQLGEGVLYVQVFEANRDRIRDPDLIYPGQVFAIPERASP
ncbi:LysM peptidoglycan-binding domain-containing protein [Tabrizicola sp. DMG-N-6]|uniref:LysM peptidoglycan-binding domain-containing protein n=1 Tax=Szabonella alba TaxID=2804194 RepID=A0A8K0Y2G7_9RHOB|nr:LysM peptidoglycan-binding domain-containing protein [Szabonella alba]